MLCVGIARHGYGAWVPIRDDAELGLQEKFYLEEHRVGAKEERSKAGEESKVAKSPGAVHLVRRANYLLSVLKDKTSNGTNLAAKKALENHHRNNRKHLGQFHGRMGTPNHGSPGPNSHRKLHSGDGRHLHQSDIRNSMDRRVGHGSPNGHRRLGEGSGKHRHSEERRPQHQRHASSPNVNGSASKPLSEAQQRAQKILEPISATLIKVSGATKKRIPDDDARLKLIKQGLVAIGNHINTQVRNRGQDSLEDQLWEYVSEHHWPQSKSNDKRVSGNKLRDMYKKIAGKDSGATPKAIPAKPKTAVSDAAGTNSSASNGAAAPKIETTKPVADTSGVKKEDAKPEVAKDSSESKAEPKTERPPETKQESETATVKAEL